MGESFCTENFAAVYIFQYTSLAKPARQFGHAMQI